MIPENFCPWAWADIRKDIMAIANGAQFSWSKEKGMTISGCTDWFKPVLFKIEKL
ncbi:MAG: TIGR04076 family protein [Desulfobacula sp.]|nr:TIGR04076 family protein [Desulfobacula sp.]